MAPEEPATPLLAAIRLLLSRAKLLTEGAGAAPLAAIQRGLPGVPPGAKVVAVLSGGNQDLDLLAEWIRDGLPARARVTLRT